MSCTICGKKTGPGALLCRPCKSALKRARQFSVLEMPGTPPAVTGAELALPTRHTVPATPRRRKTVAPKPPAAKRIALIAVSASLALGTLAYLGQLFAGPGEAHAEQARALWAALPLPTRKSPPPELAVDPERSATIAAAPSSVRGKQAAPKAPAAPPPSVAKPVPAPPVVPEAPPPSLAVATVDPPKAAPAIAQAPPPADRWQAMADSLAGCDREGGFSGFICHERVRLSSCEGYWGRVAQCPLPPEKTR